jgi:hypothetical protein
MITRVENDQNERLARMAWMVHSEHSWKRRPTSTLSDILFCATEIIIWILQVGTLCIGELLKIDEQDRDWRIHYILGRTMSKLHHSGTYPPG